MMLPALVATLSLVLAATPPRSTSSPGPTLAQEDTMRTEVPEVLVRAPRMTLKEILDRIARGEKRRDSLIVDQSFIATVRVMDAKSDTSAPRLLEERVMQVYRKRPKLVRTVLVREWTHESQKKDKKVQVDFRSDMSEEIVNFAFRPAAWRDFHYRIIGRDVIGNQVVYRIRFEPRSALDPAQPSGIVWVNTNDFVIVRQEVEFDRSPVPLLLKGVNRMVIERAHVGDFWVLNRVLLRAGFALPVPGMGRRFDLGILFDHYDINSGLPDSLFAGVRR
jgi:hypothetical protein